MAPIGFITALIGAIRVAGPPFLQALIGRARENKGKAEVEMMSSVSREVCELWNGKAVIRATGKPEIKQIIHIPKFAGDIRPKSFITLDPKSQTDDYQLTNSNGSQSLAILKFKLSYSIKQVLRTILLIIYRTQRQISHPRSLKQTRTKYHPIFP